MSPPSRSCPEMAFPVLQAVSCLSPPILGANECLIPKGVFIALIALPLNFAFIDNRAGEVPGRLGFAAVTSILSPYYFLRKSPTVLSACPGLRF